MSKFEVEFMRNEFEEDKTILNKVFVLTYQLKESEAARIAIEKGWIVKDTDEDKGLKIALMHSELSEALEAIRNKNPQSQKIPDFTLLEEELADVVLRIMNFSSQLGLRVAEAIVAKDEYNTNRPYKHGGKNF